MKTKTYSRILALALIILSPLSCVKENLEVNPAAPSGKEGFLTFDFGSTEDIQVVTKSSVDHKYEMQVHNFYLFVFDSQGAKVVGQYFDAESVKSTKAEFESTYDNCWYVKNATDNDYSTDDGKTTGTVRLKISSGTGMKIYMLANLDADMVKVSSDLLSATIADEEDLLNFNVYMNQTIVTRNGYFPMYGVLKGVTIDDSGSTGSTTTVSVIKDSNGADAVLQLKRIDAKIRFVFKTGTRPDEKGQTCESFEPLSWQVCNVPRTTYAMGYKERGVTATCGQDIVSVDPSTEPSTANYSKYASNFFDTEPLTFEEYISSTESAFTFYMLENRQSPKKTAVVEGDAVKSYQNRSRRIKVGEAGTTNELNQEVTVSYVLNGKSYERTMRCFEYMNDFSTYVVVKGRVTMTLNGDDAGQNLGAEVTYLIPLGDWSSTIDADGPGDSKDTYGNVDDYNIIRNYSYTYTVTVNSVNNIRIEVDSSNDGSASVIENQPGAYGDVTVAKEEIAICDCHYVSKTLNFHLKNFFERGNIAQEYDISDQLTWSIKTPFGEGEPRKEGGIDITDGLDYKWVHFRLNKKDSNNEYFTDMRRKYVDRKFESLTTWREADQNKEGDGTDGLAGYHNDGIMDVQALVKYMKEQVAKYLENPESSDFDSATDPKISVTVFVDEYYYDKNPLTDETSPTLWKTFVNADDRKLHILCNSNLSKDLESRSTGSVITIQQHSIQTIFNTDESNTSLETAWGVENVDEFEKSLREKDSSSGLYTKSPYWSSTSTENRGNTDDFNGLLNTAKEWGLCDASGTTFKTGSEWGKYMEIEVDNDTPQFKDAYSYLRYSCMSRNRDNNGDGKIDRSELRWYMASIQQLIGLFVGKNVLQRSTQLYNRTAAEKAEADEIYWQQHVISSTKFSGKNNTSSNNPTIIWAEEGVSTSGNNESWNYVQNYESVRCVRNLGYLGDKSDETYDLGEKPDDYIEVTSGSTNSGYIYDASHLNNSALRYYTTKELPLHCETDIENQLYRSFESDGKTYTLSTGSISFDTFNDNLDTAIASGSSSDCCPEGWRTPNQVELAVMRYYGNETAQCFSRTYFSFGSYKGSSKVGTNSKTVCGPGFSLNANSFMTASNESHDTYRCVRDIRTD
jgi:hypothetical protein